MSSGAEARVLSKRCTKLRKELTSAHESLRKSKLKTRQQEKELEELSDYNDLLRKKVKEGDLDIKRLNKANTKTRVWKRKVKSQSQLIESLKGDVEFLEEALRRDTSESKKISPVDGET